jgi:acylglycerol lipase
LEVPDLFSGLILSAPMIKVNPEEATPIKVWLARAAASLFPQLCIGTMDCKLSSRDPEQVKAYEEDPLCHLGVKARWAVNALTAIDEIQQRANEITTPYLLIHGGDDKMILPEGSEQFHAKSQSKDKTLKVYPGYYHDLLNEPKEYSDVVFNDIISWLEGHLG